VRAIFRVRGRVQGVGFRHFARTEAQALGLAGWVRNDPDGAVSGEVAGDPSRLEALRDRLALGPAFGRVSGLDWNTCDGGESLPLPFEVRS